MSDDDHGEMGQRGVSRPMNQTDHGDGQGGEMDDDSRRRMLETHHGQTVWCYWLVILLGL